jgi:hypothetical protein
MRAAHNRVQWRVMVSAILNLRVLQPKLVESVCILVCVNVYNLQTKYETLD